MTKKRIGVAWLREAGEGKQDFISGLLDLGLLGDLPFAVFPNNRREPESRQPTHNIVVTVPGPEGNDGRERIYVGAGWDRKVMNTDRHYISFKLELSKLGGRALPSVDLSGCTRPIHGRLVANPNAGERGPTYLLLETKLEADASPITDEPVGVDDHSSFQEDTMAPF